MFKRIVVPLDGSPRAEQAIPVAARLVRASAASLVLVRVALIPFESSRWRSPVVPPEVIQHDIDAELDHVKTYLEGAATLSALAGLTVETHVLVGSVVAQRLLSAAQSLQADLLVMCSHGYSGLTRWALGSVVLHVARQSSVPVLVLHEQAGALPNLQPGETRPVRVLVALDGSAFAEAAVAPAASLSAAWSAPWPGALHLAHILPFPLSEESGQTERVTLARERALIAAKAYLRRVEQSLQEGEVAGLKLLVTSSVAVHADVAEALMRMAEHGSSLEAVAGVNGCDVIAMATHGRGGLKRWALGSVTERVLGASRLPLLIVRPSSGEEGARGQAGAQRAETQQTAPERDIVSKDR